MQCLLKNPRVSPGRGCVVYQEHVVHERCRGNYVTSLVKRSNEDNEKEFENPTKAKGVGRPGFHCFVLPLPLSPPLSIIIISPSFQSTPPKPPNTFANTLAFIPFRLRRAITRIMLPILMQRRSTLLQNDTLLTTAFPTSTMDAVVHHPSCLQFPVILTNSLTQYMLKKSKR
ncbi:uncharacterized protein PV07_07910 [Cladophialophora immunda]|uniref:Uncharacterized protein n=1 Tax=Cladophialophora immunda TaxID=569365 RepID=A0A0D1ZJP7_9EURO|nr:uncharacterized protein PV07_07910 [Cladophialophora immunda]KIW28231.1 hypothetical protein PV07_07910 [Cladophialophora immunda]